MLLNGLLLASLPIAAAPSASTEPMEVTTSPSHLVEGSLALALIGNSISNEGAYGSCCLKAGFSIGVSYVFRVLRGLEVGAGGIYWKSFTRQYTSGSFNHLLLPALLLRPYLPLGSIELGLRAHVGTLEMFGPAVSGVWFGGGFVAGPDFRVWTGPRTAIQFGATFALATGHNGGDLSGSYLTENGDFHALGLWVGGIGGL